MSNEMDVARARVGKLECRLSEVNGEVLRLEGLLKNRLRLQAEGDDAVVRLAELEGQEPVFWYRPCSDGETYDGPIHNAHIERVRRLSGAWVPLYARPSPAEPVEMSPDFTDTARSALLWVLWHHQGGSSPVGQPIRQALGMDAHERLSERQVQEAKKWAAISGAKTNDFHRSEPVNARLLGALRGCVESGRLPMAVWFGEMPESNGKMNWTAILYRCDGNLMDGVTIYRSEYKDRVRYEADRLRWLIGELEHKPNILAYDAELIAEAALAEPQPDADGWIPWAGGKCPVDEDALVEIWRRDGVQLVGDEARPAIHWRWSNRNIFSDIIAYRGVKP